jgi:hypothetical protein
VDISVVRRILESDVQGIAEVAMGLQPLTNLPSLSCGITATGTRQGRRVSFILPSTLCSFLYLCFHPIWLPDPTTLATSFSNNPLLAISEPRQLATLLQH